MAVIGVILVTAIFGFCLLGYLLRMYFGAGTKNFKLSLIALGIFIIIFMVVFMIPLYRHIQEEGLRKYESSGQVNSAGSFARVDSYIHERVKD